MDLSNIPKKLYGSRVVMDWKEAQNSTVEFIYGEISGTAMLNYTHTTESSHNNKTHHFDFTFENKTISIDSKSLYKVSIGALFSKKTPEWAINFLVNEEDKNLSGASSKKVLCRCPECKLEKFVVFHSLCKKGLYCPNCHSTESMPERTVRTILEQNNLAYTQEYSHPELSHRKFDFYLIGKNIMLEVHGEHHYRAAFGEKAFLKTMNSDREKRDFCLKKNIKLIEVDARYSDIEFISQSMLEIGLDIVINRDYLNSTVYSRKEIVSQEKIKELYIQGETCRSIAKRLNISLSLVDKTLRRQEVKRRGVTKEIVCVTTKTKYARISHAERQYSVRNIQRSLKNHSLSAGKLPVTGEPLKWMYYEDYVEKYGTEGLTEYVEEEMHV